MKKKTTQKTVKDAGKSKGGKRLMIDVADFNVTKWSNTEIDFEDEKNKNSNQFTCYGRYNYGKESSPVLNQLVFKTEPIKLVTYGIPQLGKYAKTDSDREYIKVPYDTSQASCKSLFDMFQALDAWAVKNKDKFFTGKLSKFAKIYDYTPIVRKPQEVIPLDDDDEDKPKASSSSDKPQYAKVKINTDWQSKEVSTTVFLREDGVPVKQEVKTVTDLANIVTWNSTIKMICCCNKLWFGKSADKTGRRQFGISFKLLQCEVSEKVGGSAKTDFTTYAFDDEVKVEEKEQEQTAAVNASKKVEDSDDDDSDSDEEEQTVTKKVETKVEESDDDDSDDDSDEDSDEEDSKQVKGKKKVETKSTKGKKVDSDSDDDSEDEKPVTKAPQKKTTAKSSR